MSPVPVRIVDVAGGFPRVSGDEPTWETLTVLEEMFSPRERG